MKNPNERFKTKSELWDWEYETDKWEILKSPMEEERFNTLVALTGEYCHNTKILEIGCGEGLLLQKIAPTYESFLGIDISPVAIKRASSLTNEKTSFAAADMDSFTPPQKFDIIIFNESVYYSKDPIRTIKRYMNFLNGNGVIATSIYGNSLGTGVIRGIEREFLCLNHKTTVNQRGTWHCHIIRERE